MNGIHIFRPFSYLETFPRPLTSSTSPIAKSKCLLYSESESRSLSAALAVRSDLVLYSWHATGGSYGATCGSAAGTQLSEGHQFITLLCTIISLFVSHVCITTYLHVIALIMNILHNSSYSSLFTLVKTHSCH